MMRPLVQAHPDADRPLTDSTSRTSLRSTWSGRARVDVLRGARGVFKNRHAPRTITELATPTMEFPRVAGSAPRSTPASHSSLAVPDPQRQTGSRPC